MKTLIVYDSYFGNTEQIARAIAAAFDPGECLGVIRVDEVVPEQLAAADLLIAGSPTRAFRPSDGTRAFLKNLPAGALAGRSVAAFDTRLDAEQAPSALLKFLVKLFGYAAKPIAGGLAKKGGRVVAEPEGFLVDGSEGPLPEGELERAENWARSVRAAAAG